jgi:aminoglycoside phosphotransferase family enzyme
VSRLIQDLQNPAALPDPTSGVSVIQTHISVVILADNFVYKIKKPVNFGFLDFSTLEKRRHFCSEEIRLNNRLSRGIYLEVLPVFHDGTVHRLGTGRGNVADYAVRMRRIPDGVVMKSLFRAGALSSSQLDSLVTTLVRFHREALRTEEIDMFGLPERFRVNTDENFQQVEPYIGRTIDKEDYDDVVHWTELFYRSNGDLFRSRIESGKIRDCHGDLHMEHVCFLNPLAIIDCIEFNHRFRYGDVIGDMAFLLMDLEYHGGVDLARKLWDRYAAATGDGDAASLLTFYKVYRAFVRGKVNSFQLDDPAIAAESKKEAQDRAHRYFRLAHSYI